MSRVVTAVRAHWALWVSLILIGVWVGVFARTNPGQWGDHFEQFVWAHSVQWGYHKHPPLPTWLLAALIDAFGPSPYWTYLLAAACTAGTGFFTYRIALRLLDAPLAALALLLWGLQQAFSVRAQLYNHNTVMMLAVSATAWCTLRALDGPGRRWWICAGVGAGLAMLSKYQAIVPLAGLVVSLVLQGAWRASAVRRGVGWAGLSAALVFAPHLWWMQGHDFTTLRYASSHVEPLAWADRGLNVAGFLAQQVRLLFPSLLFAVLLYLLPGLSLRAGAPTPGAGDERGRERRAWFIGLIVFPLVITLLTSPAFGMKLQNHWGYQCLQFVGLWLAWRLRSLAHHGALAIGGTALAVQCVFLTVAAQPSLIPERDTTRRQDIRYPARELAEAVQRDWHAITDCPLTIVAGPPFEAGMVSVYSARPPRVIEWGDFHLSPWIRPEDVAREGAVFVDRDPGHLPRDGVVLDSLPVQPSLTGDPQQDRIYWALVPPVDCHRTVTARR